MPPHDRWARRGLRRGRILPPFVLPALLLVVAAALPAQESGPGGDGATAVAGRYAEAMRAGEYDGMAALMHPDALAELRDMFRPVLATPVGDAVTASLGLPPAADLAAATDEEFFSAFMRALVEQDPEMVQALRASTTDLIGSVPEGADTMHVVYRTRMMIEEVELSEMGVISLARSGTEWRTLLAGDVAGVAAALHSLVEP